METTPKIINYKIIILLLNCSILFYSCSSTMINSRPEGAKIFINDQFVGHTPYKHSDMSIAGTKVDVRLEMDGYETYKMAFYRSEKLLAIPLILGIIIWPFALWVQGYDNNRIYDLRPEKNDEYDEYDEYEKLRKLKSLFDDGIISKEEFENEKRLILKGK